MDVAELSTAGQMARFHAVRQRVFLEMSRVTKRWRFALIVPFHLFVLTILATRGFPPFRLGIQVASSVMCVLGLLLADHSEGTKNRLALMGAGLGIVLAIGNTGGLASPLLLSVVPMVFGLAMNPELDRKRRIYVGKFVVLFGVMAWLSRAMCCSLAGPLGPAEGTTERVFASTEYIALALASATMTIIACYHMGKGMTVAYERIALELAARREELCDENEGRTRALEGIAARLAHEVKNPLAAIKGLSTHMARNTEDAKVKERLTIVAAEAERLQEIVEGFLSFSRGLDELSIAPTKPFDIARELALLLETRAADAGVTIEVRGSREVSLNADEKKLRQALLNLVLNAMQASSRDSTVTIEVAKSYGDGSAVVRVMDRGSGMTPDVLDRIRKPYFTTKEGGSGLGIAVARGIIEQHGGALRLESTSGRGTTATVTLPACASIAQKNRPSLPNPCRMSHMGAVGAKPAPAKVPETIRVPPVVEPADSEPAFAAVAVAAEKVPS